jgi:hypothetical protein
MRMTIWTDTATAAMRHVPLSRMAPLQCRRHTASVPPEVGASGQDLGNVGLGMREQESGDGVEPGVAYRGARAARRQVRI